MTWPVEIASALGGGPKADILLDLDESVPELLRVQICNGEDDRTAVGYLGARDAIALAGALQRRDEITLYCSDGDFDPAAAVLVLGYAADEKTAVLTVNQEAFASAWVLLLPSQIHRLGRDLLDGATAIRHRGW
jgi:hypothetical protein